MITHSYKIKAYLNASHAVRWKEGTGKAHPHTWEVICEIENNSEQMLRFDEIEFVIAEVLAAFEGKLLNDIAPFDTVNPTLENLTDYLFEECKKMLLKKECHLTRIEIGESPTRFYCVTNNSN